MDLARRACLALMVTASTTLSTAAFAADLPPVKVTDSNQVAQCATPGRLMAFLKAANAKLDAKFEVVATEYMRSGEELGLRWDYAFYQMLLETNFLKYTGDVKPDQNNFAGLGATGKGARGERFKDVATGVRAHLEHLLMYSGEHIANPVAERTRNIQDWGVLTSWQKSINGPMTFTQLAKQWAPSTRGYGSDIDSIAGRFLNGPCRGDDPNPELVAEARKGRVGGGQEAVATAEKPTVSKGDELARKANEEARAEGAPMTALGGGDLAKAASAAEAQKAKAPQMNIINGSTGSSATATNPSEATAKSEKVALTLPAKPGSQQKAEAPFQADAGKDAGKACRVWTASYGGSKSVVIKAVAGGTTNYTVLDVNEGAEDKEAAAYIAAYAKEGKKIAEFGSQQEALDKAFTLCPES